MNALNEAFSVPIFVTQKLIKRNEVKPINSHPKKSIIRLPEDTKNIILMINNNKNKINLSTSGSYLKYENAYKNTKTAIEVVNKTKLNDIVSTIK